MSRVDYLMIFQYFEHMLFFSGKGPSKPAPKLIGNLIAFVLNLVKTLLLLHHHFFINQNDKNVTVPDMHLLIQIGPKGLEFARYSLDYHTIRNYLYTNRAWGKQRLMVTKNYKSLPLDIKAAF